MSIVHTALCINGSELVGENIIIFIVGGTFISLSQEVKLSARKKRSTAKCVGLTGRKAMVMRIWKEFAGMYPFQVMGPPKKKH